MQADEESQRYKRLFRKKGLDNEISTMEIEFSGWEIELESTGLAGGIEVQGGLDLDFGTMASEAANPGDNGLALDLNLGDLGSNTQNQSGAGAVQLPDEPLPIEQKPQEGAYEGNEETLLTSRKYKYDMVGSLNEMLFFFQERLQSQKNHSSNSVLQAYDSSFVGELFQISEKELEKYIGELRRILGCFSEQNLTLILSLLENPKYSFIHLKEPILHD